MSLWLVDVYKRQVQVWSPSRPIDPFIPEKVAVTVIGPGPLSGLTRIDAEASPFESEDPLHTVLLSISKIIDAEVTGSPELSINDISISNELPLTVLLSGSRSVGLSIERSENPRLSNVEVPTAEV